MHISMAQAEHTFKYRTCCSAVIGCLAGQGMVACYPQAESMLLICPACGVAGQWEKGRRNGQGLCLFADGARFRGEWEDDAWVQSAADPALCRVRGPGMARALAGAPASFTIQVPLHWVTAIAQCQSGCLYLHAWLDATRALTPVPDGSLSKTMLQRNT